MHTDFIFEELGLVEKLATSPRNSHGETPRNNKNIGMKSMQKIELPKIMRSSYPTESPF
jgi:hypothetical protein